MNTSNENSSTYHVEVNKGHISVSEHSSPNKADSGVPIGFALVGTITSYGLLLGVLFSFYNRALISNFELLLYEGAICIFFSLANIFNAWFAFNLRIARPISMIIGFLLTSVVSVSLIVGMGYFYHLVWLDAQRIEALSNVMPPL